MRKMFYKLAQDHSYSKHTLITSLSTLFRYREFRKTYRFLQKSEFWTEEQIKSYQNKKLEKLINHAYKNVPYYTNLFDKIGLTPSDIRTMEDLEKLPFLTKDIIRKNKDDLKAKNYPDYKFEYITSGGTTGIPAVFYYEKFTRVAKQMAYYKMVLKNIGCKLSDKNIDITIPVLSKNNNKFCDYTLFRTSLILSTTNINEKTLPEYISKIRKHKPKYAYTYPSSIYPIAEYMKENNIKPFQSLKGIVCIGENLFDWQKKLFEEVFSCIIISIYGNVERAGYAFKCKDKGYYHFFPQFSIVELVDEHGEQVKKEGEVGEIVGTGLTNFIFPIIRYKTGDIAVYTNDICSCGRNFFSAKEIIGRKQEHIFTKTDYKISMAAINHDLSSVEEIFNNVKQWQFYQEEKGKITVRIVKGNEYSDSDTIKIKENLNKKFENQIDIDIEFLDNIEKTKRGKHSYLVQKIPL